MKYNKIEHISQHIIAKKIKHITDKNKNKNIIIL